MRIVPGIAERFTRSMGEAGTSAIDVLARETLRALVRVDARGRADAFAMVRGAEQAALAVTVPCAGAAHRD